jgi:hypothetical protein
LDVGVGSALRSCGLQPSSEESESEWRRLREAEEGAGPLPRASLSSRAYREVLLRNRAGFRIGSHRRAVFWREQSSVWSGSEEAEKSSIQLRTS